MDWIPFHTNYTWGRIRHHYAATISGCRPSPRHICLETVRCLEYWYWQPFLWSRQVLLFLQSSWGTEGKAVYGSAREKNIQPKKLLYSYMRIRHQHSFKDLGPIWLTGSVREQRLYKSTWKLKHLPMGHFHIYISCCVLLVSCGFDGSWETADLIQAWIFKIS